MIQNLNRLGDLARRIEEDEATKEFFGRTICLETDAFSLFCVIAQVQLALRHPDNQTGNQCAEKARKMIEIIREKVPPLLQELIDEGFRPVPNLGILRP